MPKDPNPAAERLGPPWPPSQDDYLELKEKLLAQHFLNFELIREIRTLTLELERLKGEKEQ